MANPVSIPGDLVVPGNLRVSGNITPAMTKSNILELAELQAFTIPLCNWQERGDHHNMTPGTGISTGTDTVCGGHVSRAGNLIKTEMFIDLDGLISEAIGDIIGVLDALNCHIGQIRAPVNGTIVYGQITCLETPAGGDPDIDFYSTATEATGKQGEPIATEVTNEVAFTNNGDWTGAIATPIALTALPGAGYMYMVDAGGTAVEYTAGQFLLELWGTPATKTLNYVPGTHGTNAPSLQTDNCAMNDGAVAYYARKEIQMPAEYVAGQSVELRFHAGMLTTAADTTCTLDVAVYKSDEDSTSTGDLCADAAQSINSATFADKDFTITASTLSPGDLLDVQITVTPNDGATATEVKACIGSIQLLCDIR